MTDIILTTRNREALTRKTIDHILERTRSPYRLHAIDDASDDGTTGYLWSLYRAGKLASLTLKRDRCGVRANQNLAAWLGFSDPLVLADDDVLCPDLEGADWLARLLTEMDKRPDLALLALRHPGAKHKFRGTPGGRVWYCESVGATFCLARRAFLVENPLPHERGDLGRPMEWRCRAALSLGLRIGVLANVFCYHTGQHSELGGKRYEGPFIEPMDWKTLEPPPEYIGRQ